MGDQASVGNSVSKKKKRAAIKGSYKKKRNGELTL